MLFGRGSQRKRTFRYWGRVFSAVVAGGGFKGGGVVGASHMVDSAVTNTDADPRPEKRKVQLAGSAITAALFPAADFRRGTADRRGIPGLTIPREVRGGTVVVFAGSGESVRLP